MESLFFYTKYYVICKKRQFYFFIFNSDVFYSLSWLISLATTSCIMFNESGEHGHLCLRGKAFSYFTIEWDVNCGLITYGFYYIEVCFLYTQFVESSYHKRMLNFVNFSYICWDDHMLFISVAYEINWFEVVEPSFYPWNISHLIMMYDPFNISWNWFANIFLRIFACMLIRDWHNFKYWHNFLFFFCCVFVSLWDQDNINII